MNIDEHITYLHLQSRGYTDIVHEPDGNIPPDFLVNGNIAIEVRRLNKYISEAGEKKNIEDLSERLYLTIDNIRKEYKQTDYPVSSFLIYTFRRPLKINHDLKRDIRKAFDKQLQQLSKNQEYEIDENLSLQFLPSEKKLESVFRLGGYVDYDATSFVVSEICKNLGNIIKEKEKKIMPYKGKYNEWWLALVDRIGWGISEEERNEIRDAIHAGNVFRKILIINPVNPDKGIFLNAT